jgi:hypothetical protein
MPEEALIIPYKFVVPFHSLNKEADMGYFQGHQIFALLANLILSLWSINVFLFIKLGVMPKIGHGMKLWDYLWLYVILLFVPNSLYAMFELRHVLLIDHVADNPDVWSFLVFGGIAVFGFLSTVWGIRILLDYYAKSKQERLIYGLILSTVCGFGAIAGLLDYTSITGVIFPPILINVAREFVLHPTLILFASVCTAILFIVNLSTDRLYKPSV